MKPNPGTPEAIVLGCVCSVIDNNHGAGIMINGEQCFWYTDGCPVHNGKSETQVLRDSRLATIIYNLANCAEDELAHWQAQYAQAINNEEGERDVAVH